MIFLVAVCATYRLAHMIAREDGPVEVFLSLRTWLHTHSSRRTRWIVAGVDCPLCLSFWLAWLIALLLPWLGVAFFVLTSLGIAGGALVLHSVVSRLDERTQL